MGRAPAMRRWHDVGPDWPTDYVPCGVLHEQSRRSPLVAVLALVRTEWVWIKPTGVLWLLLLTEPIDRDCVPFVDQTRLWREFEHDPYDPVSQNPGLNPELGWY